MLVYQIKQTNKTHKDVCPLLHVIEKLGNENKNKIGKDSF